MGLTYGRRGEGGEGRGGGRGGEGRGEREGRGGEGREKGVESLFLSS